MKSIPKVSVVMPVFNAAGRVEHAIRSIQVQTLEDWELIAVDDGSQDETPALLKRAASKDPRILFFPCAHRGVAQTANCAMSFARGSLVARMDADDEMFPDRLARQVEWLERSSELSFVGCKTRFGGDPRRARGFALHIDWLNTVLTSDDHRVAQFCEFPLANPSLLGRREAWESVGPYHEGDFPEDYEWFLRAMEKGHQFAKVPEPLLVWNDPPSRLTRTDPRYTLDAFIKTKTPFLLRWLRRELPADRPIMIWGSGQVSRKRVKGLFGQQLPLAAWIDVNPKLIDRKIHGLPVWMPKDLRNHSKPRPFILSAVGNRGARAAIRQALREIDFVEGKDFLAIA